MEKLKIRAGDPFEYKANTNLVGFNGFLRMIPRDSMAAVIELQGDKIDSGFVFSQTDTGGWTPGEYTTVVYYKFEDVTVHGEIGHIEIQENLSTAESGFDPRSIYEKELDSALNLLLNWDVSGKYHRYKIGDREIEYGTQSELMSRIRFLRAMVARDTGVSRAMPKTVRIYSGGVS